jgi:hypothetical protein
MSRIFLKECCPGASLMDMRFSTYYSGNGAAKFSKKSGFYQKFQGIACAVGAVASSIEARSLIVLTAHVKGKCVGESP